MDSSEKQNVTRDVLTGIHKNDRTQNLRATLPGNSPIAALSQRLSPYPALTQIAWHA